LETLNFTKVSKVFGLVFIEIGRLETKEKIIASAKQLFLSYGVRAVTMDDIAREAGVSKKTIYQVFKDKNELVLETFKLELEKDACTLAIVEESEDGVIGQLISLTNYIRERFSNMHPMLLNEVKRYYPKCFLEFEKFKKEQVWRALVDLLEEGKRVGHFRPGINSEIIAQLRLEQFSIMFDPSRFNTGKYNMMETQLQIFEHFVYGILTEQGRKIYEEKLSHQLK
jgi:TetR/AcrR family transcriptional regulator, cholesterol catabolism regulator